MLFEVIFKSDTPGGKAFDVALLAAILLSVLVVMLESVAEIRERHGDLLFGIEWFFTILFTVEYGLRLASVRRPSRYATSFFGVIDLLAVLPTYLSFFVTGSQSLLVIRIIRLVRLFRIFRLRRYMGEAWGLRRALAASRYRIIVFLVAVLSVVTVVGALMYLIEGPPSGFTSIPRGIYWAIVTMTTVGYGDIAPVTVVGQILATALMLLGYGIIAVPTGIVSVELSRAKWEDARVCAKCGALVLESDARFCKHCGTRLE